jgi:hypothetical protein
MTGAEGIRMFAVHTCPLWEDANGWRRPGMDYDPSKPRVVGWVNVMEAEIAGERHRLLLTRDAD